MANQNKIEEILNKKFKQSIFSGYDTYDVDEFFDDVIEYLKNNDKRVLEAEEQAEELKSKNQELVEQVRKLKEENSQKETLLDEYRRNGYKSVVENTRIQNARANKEGK